MAGLLQASHSSGEGMEREVRRTAGAEVCREEEPLLLLLLPNSGKG
jgi:hypothetical protein